MKIYILAITVCLVICALPSKGETNDWYHIWKGQTYVADYNLIPGAFTNVTVKSDKVLMVSFQTDATQEQVAAYKKNPIKLEQIGAPKSSAQVKACSSVQGAGVEFTPVDGKIDLKISNSGKDAFKVVILCGSMSFR